MIHHKTYTSVEEVLNPQDSSILWYYIPNFNGYEISNNGLVRSMKHYRKYPFGILIKPVSREPYGSSCDPLFELSDNNNQRVKIRLSQLTILAYNNQYSVSGYPRHTCITDPTSRNDRHFVKRNIPMIDKNARYAKFTIIQNGNEMPNMQYNEQPKCIVPLVPIDNNSTDYYGRSDCRLEYKEKEKEKYVNNLFTIYKN